jgi:hypothetical protein
MRSAKVTAKALRAGFHRMVHRACPVPLGSMPAGDQVPRLEGGLLGGEVTSGADGPAVAGVEGLGGYLEPLAGLVP